MPVLPTPHAVLGKQILHHLDLDLGITEVARVLKPGGKAVFLEPLIHNPVLEGYRRLTPHLRSPTAKALGLHDIHRIATHFSHMRHVEFIFLAGFPALIGAIIGNHPSLDTARSRLATLDRRLAHRCPWMSRFYWETVIELHA